MSRVFSKTFDSKSLVIYFCSRTKQYEGKLAALNAINNALQKENEQLREANKQHAGSGNGDAGE